MHETLTIHSFLENAAKAKIREATLDGRKYLVVPTVMIVEGVHNGSQGAVFYSGEDLSAWTTSWNHKPAVVYHPKPNRAGKATAADPVVMEKSQVGFVLNTDFDVKTGKLRTETWLDVVKTDKVDPRILKSIRAGKPMEVSTGLNAHLVLNTTEAEFNGKQYKWRATKLQADHLAILPDQVGACSIAAGAGLLVTNAEGGWDGDPAVVKTVTDVLAQHYADLMTPVENGLSMTDVSSQLRELLRAANGEPGKDWYGYLVDVYPATAIYSDRNNKIYAVGYSVKGSVVSLSGDPVEVVRICKYADASGKVIDNALPDPEPLPKEISVDKTTKINALIQNAVYAEGDRAELEKLPDAVLLKIPHEKAQVTIAPAPAPTPVANAAPLPTFQQLLDAADPATKAMWGKGMQTYIANRKANVAAILAAPNCAFTETVLNAMDDATLDGLAAMVAKPADVANDLPDEVNAYLGQIGGASIHNRRAASGTPAAKPPVLRLPGYSKPA